MNHGDILMKIRVIINNDSANENTLLLDIFKDSLDALNIITEIEDEFDINIPVNIAGELINVGELVSFVEDSLIRK